jgi:hypothetical protein
MALLGFRTLDGEWNSEEKKQVHSIPYLVCF